MLVGNRVDVGLTRSTIEPMLPSLFTVNGGDELRPRGSGADRAISMASCWMENPTDKDGLLLKHQVSPPFS